MVHHQGEDMAKKSKGKRSGDDKGAEDAKERISEVDRESFLIQIRVRWTSEGWRTIVPVLFLFLFI